MKSNREFVIKREIEQKESQKIKNIFPNFVFKQSNKLTNKTDNKKNKEQKG